MACWAFVKYRLRGEGGPRLVLDVAPVGADLVSQLVVPSRELAPWLSPRVFLTTCFSSTGSKIPSSFLMCPRKRPRCGLLHRGPVFLLQNSLLGTYLQLRNLSLDVGAEVSLPSACLSWKRQAVGKWIISGLEAASDVQSGLDLPPFLGRVVRGAYGFKEQLWPPLLARSSLLCGLIVLGRAPKPPALTTGRRDRG